MNIVNFTIPRPQILAPHLYGDGQFFKYNRSGGISMVLFLVLLCVMCPAFVSAQKSMTVTGRIGIYADFYSMDADASIAPRRPNELYRFVFTPTFNYKDFSMPVVVNISPQSTSVIAPGAKSTNIWDFVSNPLNQVGIAPKYKWIQLLLGTQIPHYSELSFGDQPVFGAGLRLTPGKFRFEVFAGTAQQALAEDTLHNISGAYKRNLYCGKIGFGREEASHIYIIGGYAIDDTNSLMIKPTYTNPESGMLATLDYRVNFSKRFYFKGETALSMFSRDTRSTPVTDAPVPQSIFTTRYSTRIDGADILTIGYDDNFFGIKAIGKYYGDGYVTLGYPFMQTDRVEATLEPRFSLFKHKVNISGGIGQRINNLTGTRGATSTSVLGHASVSVQATRDLNLSGNFSNFGFRNTITNDTLRLQMVSTSYSFNPSYKINIGNTINLVSLTLAHDEFRDYNIVSGSLNDNDANSAMCSYNLAFASNPLSVTLLASSYNNNLSFGLLSVNSAGLTFGYSFLKNILRLTVGETYTQSLVDNKNPSVQLNTLLGVKYRVMKGLDFSLTGTINTFDAGKQNPLNKYTENLVRTSLIYKL